ncbi:hypothetical protein DPMN_011707 [Dreissena polymorpha]|uniref:MAM domain-containing protein n=1 Tax=Dreissena polymorpha TaxID=45954 RepID=A0A9D4N5M2_DREPO|nr:hypothetical protein DPMN_011707 [Dreissena polymorpha]
MYVESSSQRLPNSKARLVSAIVPTQTAYCLQFYYHMYGPNVNALNIYKQVIKCGCKDLN